MRCKELCAGSVEHDLNEWFEKNKGVKIIDVKYCADDTASYVLVLYEEENKDGE